MLDVRRMRDLLRFELDSFLLLLLCIISNNKNNINKRRNNNKKLDFLAFVDSTDDGSCRHRLQNFAVFFFAFHTDRKRWQWGTLATWSSLYLLTGYLKVAYNHSCFIYFWIPFCYRSWFICCCCCTLSSLPESRDHPSLHSKCIFAATSATNLYREHKHSQTQISQLQLLPSCCTVAISFKSWKGLQLAASHVVKIQK